MLGFAKKSAEREQTERAAEARSECFRYDQVQAAIQNLDERVAEAKQRGEKRLIVLNLDMEFVYEGPRRFTPSGKEHLHSPAYKLLWEHLECLGYRPYFDVQTGVMPIFSTSGLAPVHAISYVSKVGLAISLTKMNSQKL